MSTNPNLSIIISNASPPDRTYSFSIEDENGTPLVEGYSFNWNFGDGTAGIDEPNPTHTYQSAGNYAINCEVSLLKPKDPTDPPPGHVDPDNPPEENLNVQ